MSRVDIFFTVSGQRITQNNDNPALHAGDKRHFYAVFDLEDAFKDIHPKAVFTKQGASIMIDLVENEDKKYECVIPWEAMYTSGFFTVGVFGGDMMLTNALSVKVAQGCVPDGGKPLEPTPGWSDEMSARMLAIEENFESLDAALDEVIRCQEEWMEQEGIENYEDSGVDANENASNETEQLS